MKNLLISISDMMLLRKQFLIEAAMDEQENMAQIEHSWHIDTINNLLAGIAYPISSQRN